jgi:serine/threonine protein kinase
MGIGEPEEVGVTQEKSDFIHGAMPQYLVKAMDLVPSRELHYSGNIRITGMSRAFYCCETSVLSPALPTCSASEVSVHKTVGVASDLWALGCTLYELRTCQEFEHLDSRNIGQVLGEMVRLIDENTRT